MKTKIKLPLAEAKKVVVAAHYAEVSIGARSQVGKNLIAELQGRTVNHFIEFGRYLETVTGEEQIVIEATKVVAEKVEASKSGKQK